MAVKKLRGITCPNLFWILLTFLIMSSMSTLVTSSDHSTFPKTSWETRAHTISTHSSTKAALWNDQIILNYQRFKQAQNLNKDGQRSIEDNERSAGDDKTSDSSSDSKRFKTKLPSASNISKRARVVDKRVRDSIRTRSSNTPHSHRHYSNSEFKIRQSRQIMPYKALILPSSAPLSKPHTPKRCKHNSRTPRPHLSSIKEDRYNSPPRSHRHRNTPSSSTNPSEIPGDLYHPIFPSQHYPRTERETYTHGGEIGSHGEMNVIYPNDIEIDKLPASDSAPGIKTSSSSSSSSSSSLDGAIHGHVDYEANENYITPPIRRTISGRLETKGIEMDNSIRRKRRVAHQKLMHFSGYDFQPSTRSRLFLPSKSVVYDKTKTRKNKNNIFVNNGRQHQSDIFLYGNVSQHIDSSPPTNHNNNDNNNNVLTALPMPSMVLPPLETADAAQSDNNSKAIVFDDTHQNNVVDDSTWYQTNNYYRQHLHHRRRRRRHRRQTTRPTSRRPTMGQRSRSRSRPFGRNFGTASRPRRPRPLSPRNMNLTGEPVSLKVVVHTGHRRNYGRVLNNSIDTLMAQKEYEMLWDYIVPSGSLVRLPNDMPRDILQAFCSDILRPNTTTVVHVMNPFSHRRHWESSGYVAGLLATVNVPRITWGPEYIGALDKKESDFSELNISPTLNHQAQALVSLLSHYRWPYFALLYTRTPGYDTFLTSIKTALQNHNNGILTNSNQRPDIHARRKQTVEHRIDLLTTVEISNASDTVRTRSDLQLLKRTDARVVILFCLESQTMDVLDQASHQGMMGKEYMWVLTFEAINKNQDRRAKNLPLGLLGLQYHYNDIAMENAIVTAARVWLDGLRRAVQSTASTLSGTPKGLPWELPSLQCQPNSTLKWKHGHELYKFMKLSSFGDVSFNEAGQLEATNISIYNVQTVKTTRYDYKKWVEIGQWNKQGMFMKQITWPGGAPSPPSGKPRRHFLRIVTREEPPFVEYRDLNRNGSCDMFSSPCSIYLRDANETRLSTNTTQKCCTGLSIEILRKLASALDFEFRLYEVPDFQWGTKVGGKWNGIVGELRNGHADMAVSSMTIDEDKSGAINFSVPYMETGITFIVAIREGAVSTTAFLEPYDYPSWCLILVCSVHVTGASIFVFEWLSPDGMDTGKRGTSEHRFSLFRAFWLMWAMLFGAAVTTDSPRGVSSKFLSNIWALFALVFTASYTANLAAFMITKEEFYKLSGIHDLRLQNPYSVNPPFRFATVPNGTTESNIKKNYPTMYNYMTQYSQVSVEHAIEALKSQELHAFIYDASVLRYKEGKDKDCQLITVGNWYATTGYGVAVPLGSPWLERVNKVILQLQYDGEMDRLKEFWLAGACHIKRKKSNNNKGIGNGVSSATLGYLNFASAFIFLISGTGLAIVVFGMEFFFTWFGRKKLSSLSNTGWCHLISLSMGMTLSFRDSVREAMEAHRRANTKQCKSVVCETRLWKARYELKQARTEIGKLQNELDRLTIEQPGVTASSPADGITDEPVAEMDDCKLGNFTCHQSHNAPDDTHKDTAPHRDKETSNISSHEPHEALVHKNGDVTKRDNQSTWPACLLNDDDDDDEEASVRVTLL